MAFCTIARDVSGRVWVSNRQLDQGPRMPANALNSSPRSDAVAPVRARRSAGARQFDDDADL